MENQSLSSLPRMSAGGPVTKQGDVVRFLQCLRFDPKAVVWDQKLRGQNDLKRILSVALRISQDRSPSGFSKGKLLSSSLPEELKRLKSRLLESSTEARKRQRIFNEGLSILSKFFPKLSRKRSRTHVISAGTANSVMSIDSSGIGPNLAKLGMASCTMTNLTEGKRQRPEEIRKSMATTARAQPSLPNLRAASDAKSYGLIKKDKDVLRLGNNGAVLAEDNTSLTVVDKQRKSKLKDRRSGLKDASLKRISTRSQCGFGMLNSGMQQTRKVDSQSRSAAANGAVGGKEGLSRQTSPSIHSSVLRGEQEDKSLVIEKDNSTVSDKGRVKLKGLNKSRTCGVHSSSGPALSKRRSLFAQGPRSTECDAHDSLSLKSTSRLHSSSTGVNRKRALHILSPSLPVTHWARQKPQKSSRMARTHFLPIVTSNDETSAVDSVSVVGRSNSGSASSRCDSPEPSKLTGGCSALATSSKSEDAGVVEIKTTYKKKLCEVDCKAGANIQEAFTTARPTKKNKVISDKDLGEGSHWQGRTNRGSVPTRSLKPAVVRKPCNVRTAKQFRISRSDGIKAERKLGRPATRKLFDPSTCMHHRHPEVYPSATSIDDGREEILAAKAVINTSHAMSSLFWRQMEPIFGFISEADLIFLKQQGNASAPISLEILNSKIPDELGSTAEWSQKMLYDELETEKNEHFPSQNLCEERCDNSFSLWQRLTAALITEEDEEYFSVGTEEIPADINEDGLEFDEDLEYSRPSHRLIGSHPSGTIPDLPSLDGEYVNMSINEKLVQEVQSIGVFLEQSEMQHVDEDEISQQLRTLKSEYRRQATRKEFMMGELLTSASKSYELQHKYCEESALDELVTMAYGKYMAQGQHSFGAKSSSSKLSRQAVLEFVRRTLESCQKYEATGISCFSEPSLQAIFRLGATHLTETQLVDDKDPGVYPSVSMSQQKSPLCAQCDHAAELMDKHVHSYEVKKTELLLDDVNNATLSGPLTTNTKGKRSERKKERKCSGQVLSRTKAGCPASSITRWETKGKAKPKQNTTHISNPDVETSDCPKVTLSAVPKTNCDAKTKDEFSMVGLDDADAIDGMEVDLGGQGQDIGSWLNIDDDGLADMDVLGLEIPMDDLSDLKLML